MTAPECVKEMSREDIWSKIENVRLKDSGFYHELLSERKEHLQKERNRKQIKTPLCVVAALNNNDFAHVLLEVLQRNPEKVFEGMAIIGYALEAEKLILQIPEGYEELAASIRDKVEQAELPIHVEEGMCDSRAKRGNFLMHMVTAAELFDIFHDTVEEGVYLSVCRERSYTPLQKIAYGTTVREVLESTEGIKAFTIGTRLYEAVDLDMVITPDTNVGNGVITTYADTCCMVHEAEEVLLQLRKESCGKCTFCREGLIQLHLMTKDMTDGKGKREYLEYMSEIGEVMGDAAQCSLGACGADFVLKNIELFRNEYEDHCVKKSCKNNVCSAFQSMYIDPIKCTGCMECMDVCPADAIEGKSGFIHMLDEFECTKCGKCIEVCEEKAIVQTSGRQPKLPTKLTKCGRFKSR